MQQQSRLLVRRLLVLRQSTVADAKRRFTRPTRLTNSSRPQLPFLSVPLDRNQHFRYLTTERKRWLVHELTLGLKYAFYAWAIAGCSLVGLWSLHQEWMERTYPTPHEWTFLTRLRFRLAKYCPDRPETLRPDWVMTGSYGKNVIARLEDPNVEGAGLQELTEGGVWIDGVGECGYDISAKSEPWRRGYYEALMLCAKAAEHLDDHVVDTKTRYVFPIDQVKGPSNPNPKPIFPGSPSAPYEDECERAFEAPETFYMKILTTRGFSSRQRMDAALEYGSFLEFKGVPDAAERMYEWALSLATENLPLGSPLPFDDKTYVLQDGAPNPSANVLTTLTSLASHKARNNDISTALPMFVSLLRARRSLPSSDSVEATALASSPISAILAPSSAFSWENVTSLVKGIVSPPEYPPAPEDGESPPVRNAKELCEEASLNLYIGEIVYASQAAAREEGVAWTREAVDLAQEQLHKLGDKKYEDIDASKTCRECLAAGLDNWSKMVGRLAREEREKQASAGQQQAAATSSWLGLWSSSQVQQEDAGRWTAEQAVVEERTRRAQGQLEELQAPSGVMAFLDSVFKA